MRQSTKFFKLNCIYINKKRFHWAKENDHCRSDPLAPWAMSAFSIPIPSHTTPPSVAYYIARTYSYRTNKDLTESLFRKQFSLLAAIHSHDNALEQFT